MGDPKRRISRPVFPRESHLCKSRKTICIQPRSNQLCTKLRAPRQCRALPSFPNVSAGREPNRIRSKLQLPQLLPQGTGTNRQQDAARFKFVPVKPRP